MESIIQYFPTLPHESVQKFEKLAPLYQDWNSKINVISRKDIDQLYTRHVLHSLSIAKVIDFKPFTQILDIGTGGGFPGIPLAIMFPKAQFTLIDSIGKKIKVVQDIVDQLELTNVQTKHSRAQEMPDNIYDFIVSRGVTKMKLLKAWGQELISDGNYNKLPNGLLLLKGGDLSQELKEIKRKASLYPIEEMFSDPWFAQKHVVHVRIS